MKVGLLGSVSDDLAVTVRMVTELERLGLDRVFLPEAYTYDSVSFLSHLAARTSTVEIGTGIMNVFSRTPALIAMTAAGLDAVSGGRFVLGLGSSGPQVVEGFHGIPYRTPLARTREVIEICRTVLRREPLSHDGPVFRVPLPAELSPSGKAARPLRIVDHPVRSRVPVFLAALGPKNVELAAECAEGWLPTIYRPESAAEVFGSALARGAALRAAELPPLEIVADVKLLGSEVPDLLAAGEQRVRDYLALYVGGMGARGRNFYHNLVAGYGFEDAAARIETLYRDGAKPAAAAAVPGDLLRSVSLVGPPGFVAERVAALRESGVTGINVAPVAARVEDRIASVAAIKEIAS